VGELIGECTARAAPNVEASYAAAHDRVEVGRLAVVSQLQNFAASAT